MEIITRCLFISSDNLSHDLAVLSYITCQKFVKTLLSTIHFLTVTDGSGTFPTHFMSNINNIVTHLLWVGGCKM